jgi:hypothetical protein
MKHMLVFLILLMTGVTLFCFAADGEVWLVYNGGQINEGDLFDLEVHVNTYGEDLAAWGIDVEYNIGYIDYIGYTHGEGRVSYTSDHIEPLSFADDFTTIVPGGTDIHLFSIAFRALAGGNIPVKIAANSLMTSNFEAMITESTTLTIQINGSSTPVPTPGPTLVPTATPMADGASPAPSPVGNGCWGAEIYVYDDATATPIQDAVVEANGLTDNAAVTDVNGECGIVVFAHDTVSILLTVSATGYSTGEYSYNFTNTPERIEVGLFYENASTPTVSPVPNVTPTPTPTCYSCDMNVDGHVTGTDGEPLEGATIYLMSTPMAVTDAEGYYEFTTIAYGGDGCPIGDSYLFANGQGQKFIGMICGDYTYDFSNISEYDPMGTPIPDPQETPHPDPMIGDVNGDFSVTIVDALLTAQHYVGLNPGNFNSAVADVNCDGSITIVDALLIAQYYVGVIVEFC